jgi:hypothetical protein
MGLLRDFPGVAVPDVDGMDRLELAQRDAKQDGTIDSAADEDGELSGATGNGKRLQRDGSETLPQCSLADPSFKRACRASVRGHPQDEKPAASILSGKNH